MSYDPSRYRHHLDRFDISDAHKDDIINSVHRMMQSGVDRAFGCDSVQLALAECGAKRVLPASDVIDLSKEQYRIRELSETFNDKKGTIKNE